MINNEQNIINWATERGIFEKATPMKQALKTLEECTELLQAIQDNNPNEVQDAIGDIIVTLVIQAAMWGTDIDECINQAYDVIKNRKGKMINGTFVKEATI